MIPILSMPGSADITCDVDFSRLRDIAVQKSLSVQVSTQEAFLLENGARTRLDMLLKRNPTMKTELISGYEKVVKEMGPLFRVMAVNSGKEQVSRVS